MKIRILKYIKKSIIKVNNIYKKIFSYPKKSYDKKTINSYWQVRKKNFNFISPNNFQMKRAKFFNQFIDKKNGLLFDIGSGDGAQLIAIKNICNEIEIIGSEKDKFALEIMKKNKLKCHFIEKNKSIFKLLNEYDPRYVSIFEVLEHMNSPEEFILELLKNKNIKIIFASIPNSGFLIHRLRYLFGRFPLQWIANPNEHLRFWTLKDLKWWLGYLNIKENSKIIPYQGMPVLNKLMPNLFAEGAFIIIKNV